MAFILMNIKVKPQLRFLFIYFFWFWGEGSNLAEEEEIELFLLSIKQLSVEPFLEMGLLHELLNRARGFLALY
jgi:hypothetical protein